MVCSIFKQFLIYLTLLISVLFSYQVFPTPYSELNVESYELFKRGSYKESYELSLKALKLSIADNNKIEEARSLSNIASNFSVLGDNEKALEIYYQSLSVSSAANDLLGINRALNNIANIFDALEEFEEALKYRNLQLKNSIESGSLEDQLVAYAAISTTNELKDDTDSARKYIERANELFPLVNDPFLKVYIYFTEAQISSAEKDFSKSIEFIEKALLISEKHNFKGLIGSSFTKLGRVHYLMGRPKETIYYAKKSLEFADVLEYEDIRDNHMLLSKAYEAREQFGKALTQYKLVNQIDDKLTGDKVRQLAEITKIDRQVAETEEALRQSQIDQQILALELTQQKQQQIIWIAGFVMVFVLTFFWLYRRNSQRQLLREQRLNQELIELDQLKDRVLQNTSHELRTPLNGIVGLSEAVLQNDSLTDSLRHPIEIIKSSGEQLALVVNDILDLALIKSDRYTPQVSEFNLSHLVGEVITICEPLAKKKGIELKLDDHQGDILLQSDSSRIRQILFNLIGNAIKYTLEGNVQIQLDTIANEVNIVVSDTGIGIPEDKLERVFEGFEQVDSSDSRLEQGTGLGLAISKGLVQALGGSLTLNSVLGEGTQVVVNLPRSFEISA